MRQENQGSLPPRLFANLGIPGSRRERTESVPHRRSNCRPSHVSVPRDQETHDALVPHEARPSRLASARYCLRFWLFTVVGVTSSKMNTGCLTTRCSGRFRAARALRLSGRALLRTVARKARATRPAAERGRYRVVENFRLFATNASATSLAL